MAHNVASHFFPERVCSHVRKARPATPAPERIMMSAPISLMFYITAFKLYISAHECAFVVTL